MAWQRIRLGAVMVLAVLAVSVAGCGQLTAKPDASGRTAIEGREAAPTAGPETEPDGKSKGLGRILFSTLGWQTNFSKAKVPLDEIISGGPGKDGIPAIDDPKFISIAEADQWLKDREPVAALEIKGQAKAYPLQILIWHEIVNDVVADTPVTMTFCPLCNTVLAFDRRLDDLLLDFGTTGNLRFSDLVMYDRQTETWWQQATGEAIVGGLVGKKLKFIPAPILSWKDFKRAYPKGQVLSRDTGFQRRYGTNPYVGYDDVRSSPFLYSGPEDKRLAPMERVVAVAADGDAVAYPFSALKSKPVVHDVVGSQPIVVFYVEGTASALDDIDIAASRDVGATGVFDPRVDGRQLKFRTEGEGFRDEQTGSLWNIVGRAIEGPLAGRQLSPVLHGNHFWFAWAVFQPNTRIFQ